MWYITEYVLYNLSKVKIYRILESGKKWGWGCMPKIKAARGTYGLTIY